MSFKHWPVKKLSDLLVETDERNESLTRDIDSVRGISIKKIFIPTKASMSGVSLKPYKIVCPLDFAYVTVTSRNGNKISIAINDSGDEYIVSSSYVTFRVKSPEELDPNFLYMLFTRDEFDRYTRFNSWGSARETFTWEEFGRVEIHLPPLEVQKAYVSSFQGLQKLISENESVVDILEEAAKSCIVECRTKWPMRQIADFIEEFIKKNSEDGDYEFKGLDKEKQIIPTIANTSTVDRRKYLVLSPKEFVFSGMQTGRDICIRICLSELDQPVLFSPAYTTFRMKCDSEVLPEFLFLNFKSKEMDRLGWFKSDSSVRANLDWDRFCEIQIPVPPIKVQKAIISLYECAENARKIAKEARDLLEKISPALIKSSEQK